MAFPDPHSYVLVAFKRYGGFVREAGEKEWREVLPRNQTRCDRCGKRVLKRRLEEHQESPECWVVVAVQRLEAAGWAMAPSHYFVWAEACGFEIKHDVWRVRAHGNVEWARRQAKETIESNSRIKVEVLDKFLIERGPWIRKEAADAISLLAGKQISRPTRMRLLSRMLSEPAFRDMIDVLYRLNPRAKLPKELVL